ncbi:hypothetical protein KIW84_020733 [Lathyrus oleraceus]|uniref:Uncharacterized protein n=1 Tax=Pisum sativum TaxID=3888 RepID=A0A9D5B900_PEA|nr:hypothetical protein KIW84_020733 [Pisum sativum]
MGGTTINSVLDGLRGVYEYIHCSGNLLYFGIGCSPTETVYAGSYHFVDFEMDLIKKQSRSALSDYIAPQPIEDYQPMKFEFPDEDISRCSNRKIESDRSRRRGLTLNPNGF